MESWFPQLPGNIVSATHPVAIKALLIKEIVLPIKVRGNFIVMSQPFLESEPLVINPFLKQNLSICHIFSSYF
jgi:hypothetical protein